MPEPTISIKSFIMAAHAAKYLRKSNIGSMGYADMLLYGTQYEVNSLRKQIGPQVEVFEMLEMVQNLDDISEKEVSEYKEYIEETWKFEMKSDEKVVETGIKYALAVGKKIKERGYSAVTLNDVDGMKKLLGFPPAMVFMLLDHYFDVQTTPENDVMGNVTQLMMKLATGQDAHYMEYYEFFNESMLIGVPDYITKAATKGDIRVLPAAFGKLSSSLLNVSKAKDGYVTCARLIYKMMDIICISILAKQKSRLRGKNTAGTILRRSFQVWKFSRTAAACRNLRRKYLHSTSLYATVIIMRHCATFADY